MAQVVEDRPSGVSYTLSEPTTGELEEPPSTPQAPPPGGTAVVINLVSPDPTPPAKQARHGQHQQHPHQQQGCREEIYISSSSSSSEDVEEYVEEASPHAFQPKKGKSWEPARLTALQRFETECKTEAARQGLELIPADLKRALEEHAQHIFGDAALVGRALNRAAPPVPDEEIPLRWTTANTLVKAALDKAVQIASSRPRAQRSQHQHQQQQPHVPLPGGHPGAMSGERQQQQQQERRQRQQPHVPLPGGHPGATSGERQQQQQERRQRQQPRQQHGQMEQAARPRGTHEQQVQQQVQQQQQQQQPQSFLLPGQESMAHALPRLGLPENKNQEKKFFWLAPFFNVVPFMAYFRPPHALSREVFYTECNDAGCKKKNRAPGENGRVRCVPESYKSTSRHPQAGQIVATIQWLCSDCAAVMEAMGAI